MKFYGLIAILFAVALVIGCTSTPDTTNTTDIPITTSNPVKTTLPVTTPTKPPVTPDFSTPTPEITVTTDDYDDDWSDYEEPEIVEIPPTENNVSAINFTTYIDSTAGFAVEYPQTWTVSSKTIRSVDNRIYSTDKYEPDMKITTFSSEDGNTTFGVYISDFISPGQNILAPTMEWCRDSVHSGFPDVSGSSAVTNYVRKRMNLGNEIVLFDVIIPENSQWYPYAYSELNTMSYHHFYTFQFGVEDGNLTKYRDLRNYMFSSIQAETTLERGGTEVDLRKIFGEYQISGIIV